MRTVTPMSEHDAPKLSKKDAAQWFGVTVPTIDRWLRTGKIKGTRNPGGQIRFSYRDLGTYGKSNGWTDPAGHVRVVRDDL